MPRQMQMRKCVTVDGLVVDPGYLMPCICLAHTILKHAAVITIFY